MPTVLLFVLVLYIVLYRYISLIVFPIGIYNVITLVTLIAVCVYLVWYLINNISMREENLHIDSDSILHEHGRKYFENYRVRKMINTDTFRRQNIQKIICSFKLITLSRQPAIVVLFSAMGSRYQVGRPFYDFYITIETSQGVWRFESPIYLMKDVIGELRALGYSITIAPGLTQALSKEKRRHMFFVCWMWFWVIIAAMIFVIYLFARIK
jgi:Ca2+/Na+ antiporter